MNERPIGWYDISSEDICCDEFLEAIRNMDITNPGISPHALLNRLTELAQDGQVSSEQFESHLPYIQFALANESSSQSGESPSWLLPSED